MTKIYCSKNFQMLFLWFNFYSFQFLFTVYSCKTISHPILQVYISSKIKQQYATNLFNKIYTNFTNSCLVSTAYHLLYIIYIICIFALKRNLKLHKIVRKLFLRFLIKSSYKIRIQFFKCFFMRVEQIFVSKKKRCVSIFHFNIIFTLNP